MNQPEVTKYSLEAVNLIKEHKAPFTFDILMEQLYLCAYLKEEDNMEEIALECFKSVEEQS